MINADFELNQLRWTLKETYLDEEVDFIVDQASQNVNEVILDVVANAVAEAVSYAELYNIDDFIKEMNVVDTGSSFQITTTSGRTDFSVPAIEMLPHLLKSANISKDGTRYKVIPIQEKSGITGSTNSADMLKQQQAAITQARDSLKQNKANGTSARASSMASDFRNALARNMAAQRSATTKTPSKGTGPVQFRTATSLQDPKTKWVLPKKDMDMTHFLWDLNHQMQATIDESVMMIIKSYREEYR